jgi:hypothetical protein
MGLNRGDHVRWIDGNDYTVLCTVEGGDGVTYVCIYVPGVRGSIPNVPLSELRRL